MTNQERHLRVINASVRAIRWQLQFFSSWIFTPKRRISKCKVQKQIALNDTWNRFLEMRPKELLIIVLTVFVFSHSKKGLNKSILFLFTVFLAVYFAVSVYKPQSWYRLLGNAQEYYDLHSDNVVYRRSEEEALTGKCNILIIVLNMLSIHMRLPSCSVLFQTQATENPHNTIRVKKVILSEFFYIAKKQKTLNLTNVLGNGTNRLKLTLQIS